MRLEELDVVRAQTVRATAAASRTSAATVNRDHPRNLRGALAFGAGIASELAAVSAVLVMMTPSVRSLAATTVHGYLRGRFATCSRAIRSPRSLRRTAWGARHCMRQWAVWL